MVRSAWVIDFPIRFDSFFFFFIIFADKNSLRVIYRKRKKKKKRKKRIGEKDENPPPPRRVDYCDIDLRDFSFSSTDGNETELTQFVHCDLVVQGGGGSRVRRNVAPSSSPKQFVCCQKPT